MGSIDGNAKRVPEPAQQRDSSWLHLGDRFKQMSELFSAIRRPLPTQTGDDTYIKHEVPQRLLKGIDKLDPHDLKELLSVSSKVLFDEEWNDRNYELESLIEAASKLPVDSPSSQQLTNAMITKLWNDLEHPPKAYLGRQADLFPAGEKHQKDHQFRFRAADGSCNSLRNPELGAADTPYARTVKPDVSQRGILPEPGVIFDTLMARRVEEKHRNSISSTLFHFASIIIHDIFRTSHKDANISETSSYLDLAPLYGSNHAEQKKMRAFVDGKIKPDCFAEKRILGFPPGVGTLLIMFNRFHNHVVENLAQINEGGRFTKPDPREKKKLVTYDEELFQTGRLVTCGLYMNIILGDYIRTIVNLNRTDKDWTIDPRHPFRGGPPVGVGNHVSCEFNLIYRWHSTMSTKDQKWTEDLFDRIFPDKDHGTISVAEMGQGLSAWDDAIPDDPHEREFAQLKRDQNGNFSDDDLVKIMTESIEDCAHSFGAGRVPKVLRVVEMMGIMQARQWNVSTLNEFRKHFRLKEYRTFEQINPDPYVAEQLKHLYQTVDQVELYPGLVCEETKDALLPGSGLMPGFTISRAILSDAIALVRGDRFNTTEYHPQNLTNWGFAEVRNDPGIDHGCVFYKLFLNAFPSHFEPDSVYAHYPLTVPSEMKTILTRLGSAFRYTFDRPKPQPPTRFVMSYDGCMRVIGDKKLFEVAWGRAMVFLMGHDAKDFMLAGDGSENEKSRSIMGAAIYNEGWKQHVKDFYTARTRQLIDEKAYIFNGTYQVDMIRDISNMVNVSFCAEMFRLPLKDSSHPNSIFTEKELYMILVAVFTCVFFDMDPVHSYPIHQLAYQATQKLGSIYEGIVGAIKTSKKVGSWLPAMVQTFVDRKELSPLAGYGEHMIEKLLDHGMPVHKLVWGHILGTAGGMVPNQGQLFGQMLDYYTSEGIDHWPEIARLAHQDTDEAFEKLKRYMLEGSRLFCGSGVMRIATKNTQVTDGKNVLHIKKGDKVFLNLNAASRDPKVFKNPDEVDLTRNLDDYLQFGDGPHQCLGKEMTQLALTCVLKEIAKLPNLRPIAGPAGNVKKVPADFHNPGLQGYTKYLTENWDTYFPFPNSLVLAWDLPGTLTPGAVIKESVIKPSTSLANGHTASNHELPNKNTSGEKYIAAGDVEIEMQEAKVTPSTTRKRPAKTPPNSGSVRGKRSRAH